MNREKDAAVTHKAYALLEIKAFDDSARTFSGMATTPTPDRVGDIVEPLGAKFKNPLPLLLGHDSSQPIGEATFGKPTKTGIPFTAKIAEVDAPPSLKDRLDTAWASVKAKLYKGVSIGFRGIEYSFIEGGGVRFSETEIMELSVVAIPANVEATIASVKSLDTPAPRSAQPPSPGASGKSGGVVRFNSPKPQEGKAVNIQDTIRDATNERAAKVAQLDDMLQKAEGGTFDAETQTKYDGIEKEVDALDEHLERLRRSEARAVKSASAPRVIDPGEGGEAAEAAAIAARRLGNGNPGPRIEIPGKLEKGIRFSRFVGVLAHTKGNYTDAIQFAKNRFPQDKTLHQILGTVAQFGDAEAVASVLKTAVAAGTTADSAWAGPLVQYRDMVEDFIEYLRPMTIIGKLPLKRVPFNIRMPRQLTGGSAQWVGEGKAKPVTNLTFDNITMKWFKLATICVITQELARFSSPAAEGLIRDALAKAIAYQADLDFIDPDNAGTSDVKPASILNGVQPIHPAGTTEANLNTAIAAVFAPFIAANMSPETGYWIMTPVQALKISLMKNSLGQVSFPGVTLNGGSFQGMPLITSNALMDAEGSSGGAPIILLDASSILLADDGEATIDVSTQASVQMNDAPDSPPSASTVFRSLWQDNLVGIRAERYINWAKARPQAAQWIDGANFG